MKPYTSDTHGRNHCFNRSKDSKVPKRAKSRKGTKTSLRQAVKLSARRDAA